MSSNHATSHPVPRPAAPAREEAARFAAPGPRSLWLIRGDEGYGVRRALLGMAAELQQRGVTIGFASLHAGSLTEAIQAAGYPLWILGASGFSTDIRRTGWRFIAGVARVAARSMRQQRDLAAVARSFGADWLHLRSNSLLVMAGLAARSCSIPAFWHLPNTINRKVPFGLQATGCRLLCAACGIQPLANSRHTATSLAPWQSSRIPVLYPGIDDSEFSPEANFTPLDRASLGLPQDVPVFLICARVVPDKAQNRVVAAVIDLLRSGTRLALLIAGGPTTSPYFQQIQAQVANAGAHEYVRLLGPISDPRAHIALSDVVINSRSGPEPFGLTVVESMLMERPVLAYGLGGPAETVLDGATGWLIDDPSPDGYRRGIVRALADAPRWREMGRAARRHAAARFSLRATVSTYLDYVARRRGQPMTTPGTETVPLAESIRADHSASSAS